MINDDDAFEPTRKAIFEQLKKSDGLPFAATAVSLDHEMQRVHWMEQAAEYISDGYELREVLDTIAGHVDIASVSTLDELREI
jgi:hypothetical protein